MEFRRVNVGMVSNMYPKPIIVKALQVKLWIFWITLEQYFITR